MALKFPSNNLLLKPGEEPTPQRLAELFAGIQQNYDYLAGLFPLQGGAIGDPKIVRGSEALRVVRGTISTSGATSVGTGFSLTAIGTGEVKITFSPAFASTPTVVASGGATSAALAVKVLGGSTPSKSEVTLVAFNSTTGAATAGLIEFVAIGPR